MQFRITFCLVLGLTVALAGGCSCGERCRLPLLHRFCGAMTELAPSSSCDGCNTALGVDDTWYADKSPAPEPVFEASEKMDAEPAPPNPDRPAPELPDVPKPPSKELKNGDVSPKLPELKRAAPPIDDNGYNAPAKSIPARSLAGPPLENELDPSQSITITPESIADPLQLPAETNPSAVSSNRRSVAKPVEPVVPLKTVQNEIAPANKKPTTLMQSQSNPQDVSVANQPIKKIKATAISTSKNVFESPVLKEATPESDGVNNEESLKIQHERLPAKSFDSEAAAPIVLRAVPTERHIVTDRRIADRRGIGGLGLPTTDTVAFKDLPTLEEDATSDAPVNFSTPDEHFEEPPSDSRIPEIELVPQYRSLPPMEPGQDGFTKPTSYQVPVENTASALLTAMSAVDAEMVDQDSSHNLKKNEIQSSAIAQLIPHRSRVKIVNTKPTAGQVRILRLRAATPIDREQSIAPIVSIKSIMEPVIVRSVHPDANLPTLNLETAVPGIQAPSVLDEDRLGASIRGLSSRPEAEQTGSKTIER
jgi:hypothetical protein